jgi:hypothetical protein
MLSTSYDIHMRELIKSHLVIYLLLLPLCLQLSQLLHTVIDAQQHLRSISSCSAALMLANSQLWSLQLAYCTLALVCASLSQTLFVLQCYSIYKLDQAPLTFSALLLL